MPVETLQWVVLQEPLIAQEVEWVEKESPEVKQKAAKKSTTTQVFWREIQTETEHQRPLPTLISTKILAKVSNAQLAPKPLFLN